MDISRLFNPVFVTANHQLVFDPPHAARQDQHSYIPAMRLFSSSGKDLKM